jgi:hypothetical protein
VETNIRQEALDWSSDPIDVTVYPVLGSADSMVMTAAVLMAGNYSYGYFVLQTINIFTAPNNFLYPTAVIYYSSRHFQSCISSE